MFQTCSVRKVKKERTQYLDSTVDPLWGLHVKVMSDRWEKPILMLLYDQHYIKSEPRLRHFK